MRTLDKTTNDIHQLVEGLNSLHDGERVAAKLIAIGTPAVGPLTNFILHGKPSVVYQPRQWAVEALGALKAKDALLEYLRWKKDIPDPATRFAEQSVENAAARELAAWRTDDVLQVLLDLALSHPQAGVIDALGEFDCIEALPCFIRALEDDVCRIPAENALHKPRSDLWPVLRPLLKENEPAIIAAASKTAASFGNTEDRMTAVARLLEILPRVDWYLQNEIHDCLVSLYPEAKDSIDREIAKRSALPEANQIIDRALRTLLRVRRGVEAGEHGRTGWPQ